MAPEAVRIRAETSPLADREAGGIEDGGEERDGVAGARGLRGETEADALALGEVALMGHPADDLAPEAVMIFVLDALAPAPCAVGAHEEHLAVAERAGDEQRDAAVVVAQVRVDGEHFRAGARVADGGAPVEAGEIASRWRRWRRRPGRAW